MLGIAATVREALETLGTLEGFLSTVESTVLCEVVLVLESLVTFSTLVRTQI